MKKKLSKIFAVSIVFLSSILPTSFAEASQLDSNIGITFNSPKKVIPGIDGKLPNTGELVSYSLGIIGLLIIVFVIFYWRKRRKDA